MRDNFIITDTGHFAILDGTRGGGRYDHPCVWLLIELERHDKDERVVRDQWKPNC